MQRGQVLPEITETMSGEMSGESSRDQSESERTQRAGSIYCYHPATAAAASELNLQSGLSTDQLKYLQTLERNGFGKEVQRAQETEEKFVEEKNPPDYNESLIFYVVHTGVGETQCILRGCGKILKRYSKMGAEKRTTETPEKRVFLPKSPVPAGEAMGRSSRRSTSSLPKEPWTMKRRRGNTQSSYLQV